MVQLSLAFTTKPRSIPNRSGRQRVLSLPGRSTSIDALTCSMPWARQDNWFSPRAALMAFNGLNGNRRTRSLLGLDSLPVTDRMLKGVIDEYNAWTLRINSEHPNRYRAAALVVATTVDELLTEAAILVEGGSCAVWIPTAPLAGRSPADHDLDPFWSMMEAAEVTLPLDIGTEDGFGNRSLAGRAGFAMKKVESTEIHFEPFSTSTIQWLPKPSSPP